MTNPKDLILYLLSLLLLIAVATAVWGRVHLGVARTETATAQRVLAEERRDRSEVEATRSRTALAATEKALTDQTAHATAQEEISNALTIQTNLRLDADARVRDLTQRLQDRSAALRAAVGRLDAQAGAAAGQPPGDRPETLAGLLADGGGLLARSGPLVAACRDRLAQRDDEVAALLRVIDNDRTLLDGTASLLLPAGPQKLPNALR